VVFVVHVDQKGFARYYGSISSNGAAGSWLTIAWTMAVGSEETNSDNTGMHGWDSFCMPVPNGWCWRVDEYDPGDNHDVMSTSINWIPLA